MFESRHRWIRSGVAILTLACACAGIYEFTLLGWSFLVILFLWFPVALFTWLTLPLLLAAVRAVRGFDASWGAIDALWLAISWFALFGVLTFVLEGDAWATASTVLIVLGMLFLGRDNCQARGRARTT